MVLIATCSSNNSSDGSADTGPGYAYQRAEETTQYALTHESRVGLSQCVQCCIYVHVCVCVCARVCGCVSQTTANGNLLYQQFMGFQGIIAALLVAVKQIMPLHEIKLFGTFKLKMKVSTG